VEAYGDASAMAGEAQAAKFGGGRGFGGRIAQAN